MSQYLSPLCNEAQIDANGDPLVGGQVFTYAAGTSTPATTYTEDGVAQANPVVLNSAGLPDNAIWLQGGQAYKFVIKDANDVTLRTVDDISGVNDPANATTADQWVIYTGSPTYISATSFSLEGDQTNTLQVGRRVKSANTGGTRYSTITASSYSAGTGLTTVTVTNDSGTLDSGLSQVSYGLLSAVSPSLPDSAAARSSLGLTAGYSSGAGYIKLPTWLGGWIFQFGSSTTSTSADVGVTFGTTFPTSLLAIIPAAVNAGGSGNTSISVGATSQTGASFGAYQSNTGSRIATAFYYFAVGK